MWEAPQLDDEPAESYLVDGIDNIDMFRRFEKLYENYLSPGGTVFMLVDDVNLSRLYKLLLTSHRSRTKTIRRYQLKKADVCMSERHIYVYIHERFTV